jgi:RNA polymerase sigma-70 factor (ECF subfamily)
MSTTMVDPKIFEPCGGGGTPGGVGEDCFDLVKTFGGRILRLAKYITQDDSDAEDVLLNTFLKACVDGDRTRKGIQVKLATTAAGEALAKLRLRGTTNGENDPCEDMVVREVFVWGDDYRERHAPEQTADILEQAMWNLDPMCRAVFVLRDMEEVPVEQTARALDRSVAAVEVCHLRARLQLREQLAQNFRPALPTLSDTAAGGPFA